MSERTPDPGRMTVERQILLRIVEQRHELETDVPVVGTPTHQNPRGEDLLGLYRPPAARKAVVTDAALLQKFDDAKLERPAFLEAGPREWLFFDPHRVNAAIVTTGGLAPGLHRVIHSIVKRHHAYGLLADEGAVFGVHNSFEGLRRLGSSKIKLNPEQTEEWLYHGGSKLGNVRGEKSDALLQQTVREITSNLDNNNINILYVIGGDGSLTVAHELAAANPRRSIVGVPKTMDNDLLWVWQSFGFNTAVEQATRVINTLRAEAESTRRICLIELFGAEAGFVAANAALASGHVDLVLIPEVFNHLTADEANEYVRDVINHVEKRVRNRPHNPHAVVVVAEGAGTVLESKGITLDQVTVKKTHFCDQLKDLLHRSVSDVHGAKIDVFVNQPRHHIRAVPANAYDQIYCERLGALAVDNALAGYTDFMISQWLSEFVLVPLNLVSEGKKSIPVKGMFWKQVVSSTGQPLSRAERNEPVPPAVGEAEAPRAAVSTRRPRRRRAAG